jgi:hypothetical protein
VPVGVTLAAFNLLVNGSIPSWPDCSLDHAGRGIPAGGDFYAI